MIPVNHAAEAAAASMRKRTSAMTTPVLPLFAPGRWLEAPGGCTSNTRPEGVVGGIGFLPLVGGGPRLAAGIEPVSSSTDRLSWSKARGNDAPPGSYLVVLSSMAPLFAKFAGSRNASALSGASAAPM